MPKPSVATIINFCTNEARFLRACIEQCRIFSKQILIAVCDHFHDGSIENRELLDQIYSSFPDCCFIEYPFAPHRISPKVFQKIPPSIFWHCASRKIAARFVNEEIENVFFLDADEVPEGTRVLEWLERKEHLPYRVLKLSNYWYFREPRFRADQIEDSIIFAKKDSLEPSLLLHKHERDAIYECLPNPKQRGVHGVDGNPMFHHFSWVRTKEEMLHKVERWGHREDRDWKSLVEKEFSSSFSGTDFIHGYRYSTCSLPFKISLEPVSFTLANGSNGRCKSFRLSVDELLECLEVPSRKWWHKIF